MVYFLDFVLVNSYVWVISVNFENFRSILSTWIDLSFELIFRFLEVLFSIFFVGFVMLIIQIHFHLLLVRGTNIHYLHNYPKIFATLVCHDWSNWINNSLNWSLSRSYRDALEIDNYVKVNKKLEKGKFYNVKISKAFEYDVIGEIVNG